MKRAQARSSYRRRANQAPSRKATKSERKGALVVTSRNWSAQRIAESNEGERCDSRLPLVSGPESDLRAEVCPTPPCSFVSPEASVIAEASLMSMSVLLSSVTEQPVPFALVPTLRKVSDYADFRRVPAAGFLPAASFAGFLPAIGINISF